MSRPEHRLLQFAARETPRSRRKSLSTQPARKPAQPTQPAEVESRTSTRSSSERISRSGEGSSACRMLASRLSQTPCKPAAFAPATSVSEIVADVPDLPRLESHSPERVLKDGDIRFCDTDFTRNDHGFNPALETERSQFFPLDVRSAVRNHGQADPSLLQQRKHRFHVIIRPVRLAPQPGLDRLGFLREGGIVVPARCKSTSPDFIRQCHAVEPAEHPGHVDVGPVLIPDLLIRL